MTRQVIFLASLCIASAAAFIAPSAGATPDIHARFACSGGKFIDTVFSGGPGGKVELSLSDGRKLTLPQALSASGARYANADESFVFWNKGNTAFVDEAGSRTYDNCLQQK